jgi:phage I-like protein
MITVLLAVEAMLIVALALMFWHRTGLGVCETVDNKGRLFGADPEYVRVTVKRDDVQVVLMLTEEQFSVAALRAAKNPEDAT